MAELNLDEVKARAKAAAALAEKATAGPWATANSDHSGRAIVVETGPTTFQDGRVCGVYGNTDNHPRMNANAAFIAAARSDVPALAADALAVVVTLEATQAALADAIASNTAWADEAGALASVVTRQRSEIDLLRAENELLRDHASQRLLDELGFEPGLLQ